MTLQLAIIFVGVLTTVGVLGYMANSLIAGPQDMLRRRAARLRKREGKPEGGRNPKAQAVANLRRTEAKSVPFIEELVKRVMPRQSALRDRIARTGLQMAIGTYAVINLGLAVAVTVVVMIMLQMPLAAAAAIGVAAGVGLPHFALGMLAGRRRKNFIAILPDAIDLIVRGLKSGLPVTESIAIVGREMAAPVGPEFRQIADSVRIGGSLDQVMWATAQRLNVAEFNFFVISLSIQRETGGNLGETLANLSDILRRRRAMFMKVRAMSSEARASAAILSALPFIVSVIVYILNPEYISMLFVDPRGLMLTAAGVGSLLFGIGIMAKMIRFEI
jgi:tight adherence protein B